MIISSLGCGGAERVLSVMASYWAKGGGEITILTLDREEPFYPLHPDVKRHALGLMADSANPAAGLFRNMHRLRVLRGAIRDSRPDVVISFMDKNNVLTLLATRGLGFPVVVSERVDPSVYGIGRVWNFLRRHTYPHADALVCQSMASLAYFPSIPNAKRYVIPNPALAPFAHEWGAGSDKSQEGGRLVVAMGRLVKQKGFDLLLAAFKAVSHRYPDWSLLILGEGPLRKPLEEQVRNLKLESRVQLPGQVSDPFSILRRADLFVLSSRFEGFPNALLESMAAGLPVISFNCPSGPQNIIRDGVDGVLVPAEDVDALAAALDRLMGNQALRARLAGRAPEVLERFGVEKVMRMWETVLRQMLSQ
jgi:glycosyltransferase involved in cell wall biosynthesis